MDEMGQKFETDSTSIIATKTTDEPSEKSSFCSLNQRASMTSRATSRSVINYTSNSRVNGGGEDVVGDGKRVKKQQKQQQHRSQHHLQQKSDEIGEKLKDELTKYKQELKEYNDTTRDLELKYKKINDELSQMQHKHDLLTKSSEEIESDGEEKSMNYYDSSSSSNVTLHHKDSFITVLGAGSSIDDIYSKLSSTITINNNSNSNSNSRKSTSNHKQSKSNNQSSSLYGNHHLVDTLTNRHAKRRIRSSETSENINENKSATSSSRHGGGGGGGGGGVFNVLSDVINTTPDHKSHKSSSVRNRELGEISHLYSAIKDLRSEQLQYRNIIRQQQDKIADYHTRCVKAQEIMKTQKTEIEKLNVNNKQLEEDIYSDFVTLRSKIDAKLKNVAHLPQLMREEHNRCEKAMRENCQLAERLHRLQEEAGQLKVKIDELGKRKLQTINRLKAAERDLKIFKNYNAALKAEKRRMAENLAQMKEQLESLQTTSKRQMSRQRDQSEKQRRDLQKRIFDLELKLNRSQNSTSSLIQERDNLIAELQTQLHTLVHNFEVSQKHIRVLRRHIYSMTSSGVPPTTGGGGNGNGTNSVGIMKVSQVTATAHVSGGGGGGAGGKVGNGVASAIRLNNWRALTARA